MDLTPPVTPVTAADPEEEAPSLVGDPGMHCCFCPCCGADYVLEEGHIGKLLWCTCGKLMKTQIGVGRDARPPEAAMIESVDALSQCFKCHRWVDLRDMRPTKVMSEAWIPGQAVGTEEAISVTVNVCWGCLSEGDCWL